MTGRIHALALAAAVLAACSPADEPRFDAACAPNVAMEEVTCTIRNNGTAAGHACITARVQPPAGPPLIARRLCTALLEPGRSTEVTPEFEQLERVRRAKTLPSRCLRLGRWICRVDIVETPREMAGQ
jgi:hypothetical protein